MRLLKRGILGSALILVFVVSELSVFLPAVQAESVTLTVSCAHGSPAPSVGSHSYSVGTDVICTVDQLVIIGSTAWRCYGWSGTGSVPWQGGLDGSGPNNYANFTITTDSRITWLWSTLGSLSNGYVTPTSGTTADNFTYCVTFQGNDPMGGLLGVIPWTDNEDLEFPPKHTYGGELCWSTTLAAGSDHWYYFQADLWASKVGAVSIRLPASPDVFIGPTVTARAHTIVVPDNYPTIQQAIDAASDGDTIFVRSGTYYENLLISKSLTLVGEDRSRTIVDGSQISNTIEIRSSIDLSGFTFQGGRGRWFSECVFVVTGNSRITGNSICNNPGIGIMVACGGNTITQNYFADNSGPAIRIMQSSGNMVSDNCIYGTIAFTDYSLHNTITRNILGDISFIYLGGNYPRDNFIYNNDIGGVSIDPPIYNFWNLSYPTGGNYWSSYSGVDEKSGPKQDEPGSDGVGDTSFVIDANNIDNYPLIVPRARTLTVSSVHDSPVPSVGLHAYNDGDSVTCSVTSPVTEGDTVWSCTGWTGTGSVPPSGIGTSTGSFTITQDSTIAWNWRTVPSNHPPAKPSNPNPADGFTVTAVPVTLSVYVSDPDADSMTISFYNATDNSLIDRAYAVSSGSTASVDWGGLSGSTTYDWYAIADDDRGGTAQSDTWTFATTATLTYNVTIKAHCDTENTDVSLGVKMDQEQTTYLTQHTFSGLTGMHTFTVSGYDTNSHPFKQWNTGALTDSICLGTGGTFTAYYCGESKPVAVLTVQDDVVNMNTNVDFSGETSYTPDGSKIRSYLFDFGDGYNSGWVSSPTSGATHSYAMPGQYSAKLLVTNDENVQSDWSEPHEITVLRIPSFPIAVLQVTPLEASVGASIAFDASLSTDPDGWISEYGFDFGDGSPIFWTANPIANHIYLLQGVYCSKVTVSDNSGLETVSSSIRVTVPKYYTDWRSYDHNYWYTEPQGVSDPPCDSDTNLVFTLPAHNAVFQQKVATKTTLSYGRFIVRFKMSKYVVGLLGSFFLYCAPHGDGAPDHQEIDVEWWGKESSAMVHFVFWQNGGKGKGIPTEDTSRLLSFSLDDGKYHTCEINYQKSKVVFIIDGITYYEKTIAIIPPLYFFTGQVWARQYAPSADYRLYVDSTEIWQNAASTTSALSISAKSPVNLFLIDPLNRSIGTDPNTGRFLNEIPDAFYTGPYAEPQNILVPDPLIGNYIICASGTGNDNYTLTVESVTNTSFIDAHSWQGTINAGQVISEKITLDPGGGVVLTHDVRTENLTPLKTIVGRGYCIDLNFTVEDCGNCTETFNVSVYVNQTTISQFINVTLTSRDWTTLLCEWNTTGFSIGDYAVIVVADPIPGELDIGNNNCTCSFLIHVGVPGDVTGPTIGVYDRTVNMRDIQYIISLFNTTPISPNWNPNADINNDGIVNMRDVQIAILHFNQHE